MRGRGWATTSDVTKIRSPRRRSTMPAPKARTSCWAPPMLTRRTSSKSSGLVSSAVPGRILAALDTRISTGPNAASASLANRVTEPRIRQVEVAGHRLSPLGPDGRSHLVAHLDAARPEHHGMARPGQRPRRLGADARGGAGHRRRPAFGVRLEARHQRSVTEVGSAAKPRTLMECTRRMPAGSTS